MDVDRAVRWGYSHEMGPFEIWNVLGVAQTAQAMEANDIVVAEWVKEMLAIGHESFYRMDEAGLSYYHLGRKGYVSMAQE